MRENTWTAMVMEPSSEESPSIIPLHVYSFRYSSSTYQVSSILCFNTSVKCHESPMGRVGGIWPIYSIPAARQSLSLLSAWWSISRNSKNQPKLAEKANRSSFIQERKWIALPWKLVQTVTKLDNSSHFKFECSAYKRVELSSTRVNVHSWSSSSSLELN